LINFHEPTYRRPKTHPGASWALVDGCVLGSQGHQPLNPLLSLSCCATKSDRKVFIQNETCYN